MFAALALLPPLLQDILGYPVTITGIVTAPRGLGTLVAMIIVGRLITWVDARLLMAVGISLTAVSLWQMCGFSPLMDERLILWSGFIQGLGLGLTYVPLTTLCFATLAPQFRSEGTSMFNLLRNIGSSIGISAVQALLTRNTQIMHSRLAEHISRYDSHLSLPAPLGTSTHRGLEALNAMVTRQAQMIAYNNDFKLMLVLTLASIPFIFLFSAPRSGAGPAPIMAE
jgi:DHA2 family multidrug resistance protein